MESIDIDGSYYEMGQQYGRILEAVGYDPRPVSAETAAFVQDSIPAVTDHMPDLLEELRGIADVGGWELEPIIALPVALGYESGCSVVAVAGDHTTDGSPLFGRNYDFHTSFADFGERYRTQPAGRLNSINFSDHWVGRHGGVNEAGLAIGHTFVPNDGPRPGIMFGLAARWVLDTCRTTEAAVCRLESIPHARNTNFVVGDQTGEIAVVEASPSAVSTTRPDGGFAAVTNHFVSESMQAYQPDAADLTGSTRRYSHLHDWFETASTAIDIADVQQVLADPEAGACSCADPADDDPVETLWSWTAALEPPAVHLADGRPDETDYDVLEW